MRAGSAIGAPRPRRAGSGVERQALDAQPVEVASNVATGAPGEPGFDGEIGVDEVDALLRHLRQRGGEQHALVDDEPAGGRKLVSTPATWAGGTSYTN